MASRRILTAAQAVGGTDQFPLGMLLSLRPTIIGPRASLYRYSVAAEKQLLGEYDSTTDTELPWPLLGTDEVPDLTYTKVYLEDARLKYFTKTIGVNGTAQVSSTYPNRLRLSAFVFKTANSVDRSSDFYDRDVAIGDIVKIRRNSDILTTSVTGFVAETVAASIGSAAASSNNKANQSLSVSISQTSGTPTNQVVAVADGSAYSSYVDGGLSRTYTITITQGSTGGVGSTAVAQVISNDGLDNQANVQLSDFGVATNIGTKGLTVTFSIDGGLYSSSAVVDQDDFLVGQQWVVTVNQDWTAPTVASAGTYTGTETHTYLVSVSKGGTLASGTAEITVNSSTGYDASGPTLVTGSGNAIAVGNYGVTIAFTGTALRKGDLYTIVATAASDGAIRTLVLADTAVSALRGVEVDVDLYIPQDGVELSAQRTNPTLAYNWTQDVNDGITLKAGIYMTDPSLTDGGDLVAVPLTSATVYAHYRAWSPVGVETLTEVTTRAGVAAAFGTVDVDNPLAWAIDKALANTAGDLLAAPSTATATSTDVVIGVAVGTDPTDLDLWSAALTAVEGEEDAGQIVLLSDDADVFALGKAHVVSQSNSSVGFYRSCWVIPTVQQTHQIVGADTSTNSAVVTATIAATPATSPTEYTTLTLVTTNANFTTAGVRAGDEVRISYATDALGNVTYDTYEVESVISTTSLLLVTGPDAAIGTAIKVEIWRTDTKAEYAARIAAEAATYATDDGRVRVVWPDVVTIGGESCSGTVLCAALAGLAGSVPSNQGLGGVGVAGIDSVARSSTFFAPSQLNTLAAGGVFVVSADRDGNIFVRNAVTPDTGAIYTKYEMCVRNADVVRGAILDAWAQYIGAANVTDQLYDLMSTALLNLEKKLKAIGGSRTIGAPISSLTLVSLETVPGHNDQISATVQMTGPNEVGAILLTLNVTTGA